MANYHAWLQQVVLPYADPGRTFRDVDVALMTYPTLRPKTDNFTRQGPIQLLICLFGHITCGGYNVPLEIWLPRTYPRQAPIVYVTSGTTPGMGTSQIRPTQHVDPSGRVYHPHLAYWNPRPDASTILHLLRTLVAIFTSDPPQSYQQATPISGGVKQSQPQPQAQPAPVTREPDVTQLRGILRERLIRRFKTLQQDLVLRGDRLLGENTLLAKGEDSLKKGLALLQSEVRKMEEQVQQTRSKKEAVIAQIAKLNEGDQVDVDRFVIPQGPIARQIISLTIAELSIQDCIYALTKAFFEGKSRTSLPSYIRLVRDLAREQFMAKALLLKIRKEFPIIK